MRYRDVSEIMDSYTSRYVYGQSPAETLTWIPEMQKLGVSVKDLGDSAKVLAEVVFSSCDSGSLQTLESLKQSMSNSDLFSLAVNQKCIPAVDALAPLVSDKDFASALELLWVKPSDQLEINRHLLQMNRIPFKDSQIASTILYMLLSVNPVEVSKVQLVLEFGANPKVEGDYHTTPFEIFKHKDKSSANYEILKNMLKNASR
jgi:hypothetical protein